MFLKLLLLLSLILNGYFYIFHFNTSQTIVKTKIVEKEPSQIAESKPSAKLIKKSSLSPKEEVKAIAEEKTPTNPNEDFYYNPYQVELEEAIAEHLKFQLKLQDQVIKNYQGLKKKYQEELNNVFNIPQEHNPDEPYIPSYKEHKKYYDLLAEYHDKLKALFGTDRYQRYEKLRRENNERVMKEWQVGQESDLQYMHL